MATGKGAILWALVCWKQSRCKLFRSSKLLYLRRSSPSKMIFKKFVDYETRTDCQYKDQIDQNPFFDPLFFEQYFDYQQTKDSDPE